MAVTVVSEGGVTVITLSRPEVMNALNAPMRAGITAGIAEAVRVSRVAVITGAGRAFCSGQDLNDGSMARPADVGRILQDEYVPMLLAITEAPIPVIAAVGGAAAGAGANLALACDVVIASEAASFTQAFTRIGLIPDAGGTFQLPRLVGQARAMGAALFAEAVPARQAAEWGMIWEAVPETEFAARWRGRAEALAAGPTGAYARLKQACQASANNDLRAQLAVEARLQAECAQSPDFAEGVAAFLDRRPARFTGA